MLCSKRQSPCSSELPRDFVEGQAVIPIVVVGRDEPGRGQRRHEEARGGPRGQVFGSRWLILHGEPEMYEHTNQS